MEDLPAAECPCRRQENLLVEELNDETLVYDLDRHKAYCLNRTAALVWKNCNGGRDVQQLQRLLQEELETTIPEGIVAHALARLGKLGLLTGSPEADHRVPTRRQMLLKVGKTAAWLVPVVTAMVAPTPAQAATNCPARTGQSCALFGCANGSPCGVGGTRTCTNGTCH